MDRALEQDAQMAGLILATAQDETQTLAAHINVLPNVVVTFDSRPMKVDADLSHHGLTHAQIEPFRSASLRHRRPTA